MEGISFFLFFFLVVPFVLMNIASYRKERRNVDEQLISLLKENNNLLWEFLEKKSDIQGSKFLHINFPTGNRW